MDALRSVFSTSVPGLRWLCVLLILSCVGDAQWVTRDHRGQTRGPWMWALPRELPQLYAEFNGIDFGHAHIAETLLRTQDPMEVEKARLEVLDFIMSRPPVPPDEEQIAPTFVRMAWEAQRAFVWAHSLHRSLYDLFAADAVTDKDVAYRRIMEEYLSKPEAITPIPLDHHGALWSFPESKAFRDKFPKFNSQIWAYHWLQAGTYDVQLLGPASRQRELMPRIIQHYHGYLHNPPIQWRSMPMMAEAAPEFSRRYPEATAVFDNLHMLHDNIDDVLSRPDLYPGVFDKRKRLLEIIKIYLHRNQSRGLYSEYRARGGGHGMGHAMKGARPPSARQVLGLAAPMSGHGAAHGAAPTRGHAAEHEAPHGAEHRPSSTPRTSRVRQPQAADRPATQPPASRPKTSAKPHH